MHFRGFRIDSPQSSPQSFPFRSYRTAKTLDAAASPTLYMATVTIRLFLSSDV